MNAVAVGIPITAQDDFFGTSLELLGPVSRRPVAWRQVLQQSSLMTRVSIFSALMLSILSTVLLHYWRMG